MEIPVINGVTRELNRHKFPQYSYSVFSLEQIPQAKDLFVFTLAHYSSRLRGRYE